MMTDFGVPPEAVEAVLSHRWGGGDWQAHTAHYFAPSCAVCARDVERILAVAAPLIAAAALHRAAGGMAGDGTRWLANHRMPPRSSAGMVLCAVRADLEATAEGLERSVPVAREAL
jgi:hypothetical protein